MPIKLYTPHTGIVLEEAYKSINHSDKWNNLLEIKKREPYVSYLFCNDDLGDIQIQCNGDTNQSKLRGVIGRWFVFNNKHASEEIQKIDNLKDEFIKNGCFNFAPIITKDYEMLDGAHRVIAVYDFF